MTLPGRPAGLGEGSAFHTLCEPWWIIPFDSEPVKPCGTDFPCMTLRWPGTRPRRATFFLVVRQERRQRNVPRCRAPFGSSLPPAMPGGVFANSPYGLRHAKPFFRPSSPPVGTSEGTGNAGDQRSVALSVSGEARCSSVSPSEPPSSGATGGEVRRSCLSPKGEFCAGRPL